MRKYMRNTCPSLWAGLFLLATTFSGRAHLLPISYLLIVPDAQYLHLELVLNPFELSFFSELDTNKDGQLSRTELESKQDVLTRRILDCLKVQVGGKSISAETAGVTPDIMSHHVALRAHYRVDARYSRMTIESTLFTITSGSHLTQVTYQGEGPRQLAKLDMQSTKATFVPAILAQGAFVPLSSLRVSSAFFGPLLVLLAIPAMTAFALGVCLIRRQTRPAHAPKT
jgi:hypothetical protein